MRKILLLPAIVLFNISAFAQAKSKRNTDDIALMLKKFYSYYILESYRMPLSQEFSADTLKKYCSASFLKRIHENKELDYDPIVYAQDFDTDWVNTLKITKMNDENKKKYNVCYFDNYERKYSCIRIFVVNEAGVWKIDKTCQGNECN